jgi:hypothetical protein
VYTSCLVCASPFEANEQLTHAPHGRRLAFDPARGRLWAVCRVCRRWSLMPIEDRWEALEELEKLTVDKARLLSQTDNISLFRNGPLEIVRVGGKAQLTEESWWRYGRELASRKRQWDKLGLVGTLGAGAVVAGGWAAGGISMLGVWLILGHGKETVRDGARWLRFGSSAWRGEQSCAQCGYVFRSVGFGDRAALGLFQDQPGQLKVVARCPRCRAYRDAGLQLEGDDAKRTLRRVLAYHHFAGASEQRVFTATRLIQEAGSPRDLARIVVKDGKRIGDLRRTGSIALEIAVNEENEQHLLELELADLEAHWRREEELASIIDGELTPLPMLEQMRRMVARPG